jgi:hypothetical protein
VGVEQHAPTPSNRAHAAALRGFCGGVRLAVDGHEARLREGILRPCGLLPRPYSAMPLKEALIGTSAVRTIRVRLPFGELQLTRD